MEFASARDRNKINAHLARELDPPILDPEAQTAYVSALVEHEIEGLAKLTSADAVVVFAKLGL